MAPTSSRGCVLFHVRALDEDLPPHRTRSCKAARPGPQFKERAGQVRWCYAHAARLAAQGIWLVAADENPPRRCSSVARSGAPSPGPSSGKSSSTTGTANLLSFLVRVS